MNRTQLDAFSDEMEKIAASIILNHGTKFIRSGAGKISNTLKGWGSALRSTPRRTGQAVGDIVRSPRQALREGWHATWHDPATSGGMLGRGMFALGTAGAAATAIPKDDPMGRGESRLTRTARFAGGTLAGVAGMKRGVLPSIALSMGGDIAGGYAGRAVDKVRGYKPKARPTSDLPAAVPQRVAQPAAVIDQGMP